LHYFPDSYLFNQGNNLGKVRQGRWKTAHPTFSREGSIDSGHEQRWAKYSLWSNWNTKYRILAAEYWKYFFKYKILATSM